jgi:hypothetical protein
VYSELSFCGLTSPADTMLPLESTVGPKNFGRYRTVLAEVRSTRVRARWFALRPGNAGTVASGHLPVVTKEGTAESPGMARATEALKRAGVDDRRFEDVRVDG